MRTYTKPLLAAAALMLAGSFTSEASAGVFGVTGAEAAGIAKIKTGGYATNWCVGCNRLAYQTAEAYNRYKKALLAWQQNMNNKELKDAKEIADLLYQSDFRALSKCVKSNSGTTLDSGMIQNLRTFLFGDLAPTKDPNAPIVIGPNGPAKPTLPGPR